MSNSNQEFETYFSLFDWGRDENGAFAPEDWPMFRSPESVRLVREKAAEYGGLISISHFVRAFSELKASGAIRQVRATDPFRVAPEEKSLTASEYFRMKADDVIRLYRSSPKFKNDIDELVRTGQI